MNGFFSIFQRLNHQARRIGIVAFSALAFIWAQAAPFSTGQPDVDAAISTLANYSSASHDDTDKFLARIGFKYQELGVAEGNWRSLSPHAKILTAYQAAENAKGDGKPTSGKSFLYALRKEIGAEYQAAAYTKLFRDDPLFPTFEAKGLHFSRGPPTTSLPPTAASVPTEIKEAIATLAKYTAPGTMGDPHNLLSSWFSKLSAERALNLVMDHSWEKAIEQGLRIQLGVDTASKLDPKTCRSALRPAVNQAAELFQAASFETSFKAILSSTDGPGAANISAPIKPDAPTGFNSGGGGGGGGGGSPSRRTEVRTQSSSYRNFTTKNYPTPKSRGFRVVRASAGGFGGIVLGNTVTADESLKAKRVSAIQLEMLDSNLAQAGDNCLLRFKFADGTEGTLSSVALDHAKLAARILYTSFKVAGAEVVVPPAKDEAIGLISLQSSLNDEATTHPALIGEPLWRSLTSVDRLEKKDEGPYTSRSRSRSVGWLSKYTDDKAIETWKITDCRSTIVMSADLKIEVLATHSNSAGNPLSQLHLKSIYFEGIFWGKDTNQTALLEKEYAQLSDERSELFSKNLFAPKEKKAESEKLFKEIKIKLAEIDKKIQAVPPILLPIWSERLRNDAPSLIAGSDAFFQFNRFIRVFQAMRWARDVAGAPEPRIGRSP